MAWCRSDSTVLLELTLDELVSGISFDLDTLITRYGDYTDILH